MSALIYLDAESERGYRLGISGPHDELARTVGATPRITRFAIRPASLEDVYFALTREADVRSPATTPIGKAV